MSNPSLTSLRIDNLRGSTTPFKLSFEKGKRLTIIYGENGTGKSTISDAFDLLGNAKVGSLESRGIGQTRKYWPSIGKKNPDVKVTLETSVGSCVASLGTNDVLITNEELRPEVAILRRKQILSLIESEPAKRYLEISRFIDVSGVEASEASLRQLILNKSRAFETVTTRIFENQAAIERIWTQEGCPMPDYIKWAEDEVRRDQSILNARKAFLDRLISEWDVLVKIPLQIHEYTTRIRTAETSLLETKAEQERIIDLIEGDYLDVLDILKAAKTLFEKHPNPTVCPLCGSSEKASTLVDDVNRRLQAQIVYSQLESIRKLTAIKEADFEKEKQRLNDQKIFAVKAAASFELFCQSEAFPSDLENLHFPLPEDFSQWSEWFSIESEKREQWKSASDACVVKMTVIRTLKQALNVLNSNKSEAKRLELLLPRLNQVKELVEGVRKKFTAGVLNAISSRVDFLYEKVHPSEGLSKIGLALDAVKRASLEISAEFEGSRDAPPQAYFSDSHLDTLGLCVFLALEERESPENKILVLDDVLSSVDEPHVDRVIMMIYEVAERFRYCMVMTHYGPWRHKYRWGWLQNGHCQFIELTHWTMRTGITHIHSIPEVERLRSMLSSANPDLQAICAKSGVILEAILDFITLLYECYVPRRLSNNYTLGDLLPAIDSKLRKALRVEQLCKDDEGKVCYAEKRLESSLAELSRIQQVRNVTGCHFNELTFELLDSDSIAFGTEVLNLADTIIDYDTGWPRNGKSGAYWATSDDTRRLYPLRRPS
jgi:hypothetical protein